MRYNISPLYFFTIDYDAPDQMTVPVDELPCIQAMYVIVVCSVFFFALLFGRLCRNVLCSVSHWLLRLKLIWLDSVEVSKFVFINWANMYYVVYLGACAATFCVAFHTGCGDQN